MRAPDARRPPSGSTAPTIDAIRLYHEATGVGLKEAKDAIDALRGGS